MHTTLCWVTVQAPTFFTDSTNDHMPWWSISVDCISLHRLFGPMDISWSATLVFHFENPFEFVSSIAIRSVDPPFQLVVRDPAAATSEFLNDEYRRIRAEAAGSHRQRHNESHTERRWLHDSSVHLFEGRGWESNCEKTKPVFFTVPGHSPALFFLCVPLCLCEKP
jgi:hypothetical protein